MKQVADDQRVLNRCEDQSAIPKNYIDEVCCSRFNDLPLPSFLRTYKLKSTIQKQGLKNEYDAVNVRINPVQYTIATHAAFAYECPAFAYVIIFAFD